MTTYLGALWAIALSLAVLLAPAWVVQQRTGISGWVGTIWTFAWFTFPVIAGIPPLEAQMLRSRGKRYRAYQARTSMFFPLPPKNWPPKNWPPKNWPPKDRPKTLPPKEGVAA